MIKKTNEVFIKSIPETEAILREMIEKMIEQERDKKLSIDTVEKLIGESISKFTQVVLGMSGELLSNLEVEKKKINNVSVDIN